MVDPRYAQDEEYEQHYSYESLLPMLQRYANDSSQLNFLAGKAAERIAQLEAENHTLRMAQKACETCDAPTMQRIAELEAQLRDERRLRRIYQLEAQQGRIEALGGDDE